MVGRLVVLKICYKATMGSMGVNYEKAIGGI
jgi:hypothetical protein